MDSRRAEQRFRCALAVTLRRRGEDERLLTSDISFRGAYVRTGTAPPANALVRLVFSLPPDNTRIATSAHVIRVVQLAEAHKEYAGFVARFVGFDGPVKTRWEALISWVRTEYGESVKRSVTFASPSYLKLFAQKGPTGDDVWLLPASVAELRRVILEEIPTGTVLAAAATRMRPGENVIVRLVHPITEALVLLPGVVRRRGDADLPEGGVLVGVFPPTESLRKALSEMAESVIVVDDYDVELDSRPELEPGGPPS